MYFRNWFVEIGLRSFCISLLLVVVCTSCNFEDTITVESVDRVSLDVDDDFNPILTVYVSVHNASSSSLYLRALQLSMLIDDKQLAEVDEKPMLSIKPKSSVVVPLTIRLTLEEKGLVGKLVSIISGDDYTVKCTGYATLLFWGLPIRVPIHYVKE